MTTISPEQWAELVRRVERLEGEAVPATDFALLLKACAAIHGAPTGPVGWKSDASAAFHVVADWLADQPESLSPGSWLPGYMRRQTDDPLACAAHPHRLLAGC
jgi:hypothetical protein